VWGSRVCACGGGCARGWCAVPRLRSRAAGTVRCCEATDGRARGSAQKSRGGGKNEKTAAEAAAGEEEGKRRGREEWRGEGADRSQEWRGTTTAREGERLSLVVKPPGSRTYDTLLTGPSPIS